MKSLETITPANKTRYRTGQQENLTTVRVCVWARSVPYLLSDLVKVKELAML